MLRTEIIIALGEMLMSFYLYFLACFSIYFFEEKT